VRAIVWTDYLCPWCYLGHDRTRLMRDLGVDVTPRPFELHPEIPIDGRAIRPDGRLSRLFDRIEAECDELGLPFLRPQRVPNSRRALETAELVRLHAPECFPTLDESLFRAHWVEGLDLGDPDVLDRLVIEAGAPLDDVHRRRERGEGDRAVESSMTEAREHGITSTPTWLVGDGLLIPGAQPRDTIERWVVRLMARADPSEASTGAGRIGP
jgi:predicted DsbA family dithiol-disulfide isomerase